VKDEYSLIFVEEIYIMKFARLLILLFAISALTPSCRKGPEDPLLSLRSRKVRISKEWQAYSYFFNGVEKLRANTTTVSDRGECGDQTVVRYDSLEIFMTFEKTGEFKSERFTYSDELSSIEVSSPSCNIFNFTDVDEDNQLTTGYWNFTGGVGNTSAREQIFIYEEETQVGLIWDIVRLANEELKIRRRYIIPGQSTFTVEEIWFRPKVE
jgi:hypothetical protein